MPGWRNTGSRWGCQGVSPSEAPNLTISYGLLWDPDKNRNGTAAAVGDDSSSGILLLSIMGSYRHLL